ncbi:hypothetical protein [Ulvibacterium sp.]|uniref:hypothetical protein n=1 Tax=Ulvibacterium sp. TaxID=2665914 RepID=UPI003BABAAED
MKKNILFSILFVVLMFLGSCERESLGFSKPIENKLSKDVAEIKAGWEALALDTALAGFPMNEMMVDWENPIQRDSISGTVYEFPMTQEFPTVLNSDHFEAESLSLVVYEGTERLYRVVRMLHTTDSSTASTFLEPTGLDGTVHVYDLQGVNILIMAYEKGVLVASAVEEGLEDVPEVDLSKTARCSTRKSASWASLKRSYNSNCNGGGGYNRVRVEHYTDWFNHRGNGQWEFQRSEHTGTTYEYVYSSGAGYGGATIYREKVRPNGGSSVLFNSWWRRNSVFFNTTPEGYEKKYKIFNNLTGKADCVYKKLKIHSGNFRKAIRKFDPEFPVTHLTFELADLSNSVNASTKVVDEYNISIRINRDRVANRTVLELARSFAHEIIHAELFRKVKSVNGQISIDNFEGIYDYYRRHTKNWQHEQMAAHYIETISTILKEFDGSANSEQFYKDLSWEGLHETVSWKELPQSERDRILNVVTRYKQNGNKTCTE